MATETERLQVLVESRVTDFERGMKSVERRMAKMESSLSGDLKGVERASRNAARRMEQDFARANSKVMAQFTQLRGAAAGALGGLGMGAGAGLLAGFSAGSIVREVNEAAASIAEMAAEAKRAGLSFEAFQELRFAFGREQVSIDALTDGFKELQLRADEFIATGKGSGAEAFARLGYGAQTLAQKLKDPKEFLFDIIDRLQKFDRAAQIRIFDELAGGTGGEQFVQLLDAGSAKLRQNINLARELGVIMGDDVADEAVKVNAEFNAIAAVIETRVKSGLVNVASQTLSIARNVQAWSTAAEDFLAKIGNSEAFAKLNKFLAAQGLLSVPSGMTILDPGLRSALGLPTLVEEQRQKVAELEKQLAEADQLAGLPESKMGITGLRIAKENAAEIRAQLAQANAELARMGGTPSITVTPGGKGSAAPTSAPTARDFVNSRASHTISTSQLKDAAAVGAAVVLSKFPELSVSSAHRDEAYNRSVGGAKNSRHIAGDALDFVGVTPDNVGAIVDALRSQGFQGFGYYNNGSLHADMGAPRAWGPDRTSGSLSKTPWQFQEAVAPVNAKAEQAHLKLLKDQNTERERQQAAINAVNESLAQQLELAGLENDLLSSGKFTLDEVNAALDKEALIREKLNQLKAAGVEVTPQMEAAIRAEAAAIYEAINANEQLIASQEKVDASSADLANALAAVGQPALDTFMSIIDGSAKAEDAIRSLVKQLANMALQAALFGSGPLGTLFGGGLLGRLFPARATGGPVSAGQPYMVGERGKELFVPGQSGRIIDAARTRSLVNDSVAPRGRPGASGPAVIERYIDRPYFSEVRVRKDGGLEAFVQQHAGHAARAESDQVRKEIPSRSEAARRQSERRRLAPARGF